MKRQVLKKTILVSFLAVTCVSYMTAYSRAEAGSKLLTLNNKIQGTAQKAMALAASSPEKAQIISSKLKNIQSEVDALANTYMSTGSTDGAFERQYKKVNGLADDLVTFLGK